MAVRRWIGIIGLIGIGAAWALTRPTPLDPSAIDGIVGDATKGASVFAAAGCASCHTAKDGPNDVLSGGKRFQSDFGTFIAPNISPDATHGIGEWSELQLASAITKGVSANRQHLYPAFPYASYNKATLTDVMDLIAYMHTLPISDRPNETHEVGFPFNIRAALGGWKLMFVSQDWILPDAATPQIARGRYLSEALGHCGECHTPRNLLGGLQKTRWLGGAPHPSGEGRIPNITTAALKWSEGEIAEYLKSGFTPDFDTAGGEMAEVVRNTGQLSDDDRAAIAAYLKAVPPVADGTP